MQGPQAVANTVTGSLVGKGLEVSFHVMTALAVVDYPFEYNEGIVLKGYSTALVATEKSYINSQLVVQWHFEASERNLRLSELTTKDYHIWDGEESPTIELVSTASRTFVGWNRASIISLALDSPSKRVGKTMLPKVGSSFRLKSIGVGAAVGKAPFVAMGQATFELQQSTQRHTRDQHFPHLIEEARKQPTLLYSNEEDRGWLVPQLSVLHCMAFIYIRESKMQPEPPKASCDPADTRKTLLDNSETKFYPQDIKGEQAEANSKTLKDIFLELYRGLEFTEEHARHRHRLSRVILDRKIYGFELWDIANAATTYDMKLFTIKDTNGGWIKLLDEEALRGVVFCKGLGEVITQLSPDPDKNRCTNCKEIPRGWSYLTASVCCLQALASAVGADEMVCEKLHYDLGWDFKNDPFVDCTKCSSHSHRLQSITGVSAATRPPSAIPATGMVVFGDSPPMKLRKGSHEPYRAGALRRRQRRMVDPERRESTHSLEKVDPEDMIKGQSYHVETRRRKREYLLWVLYKLKLR